MTPQAWFSIAVVAAIVVVLALDWVAVEVAMLAGLAALILGGAVELEPALSGFAHPAVLMIAALFVVAAGLTGTGVTQRLAQGMLGRPVGVASAQLRLMGPVVLLSAFLNNTPIVAMYLPIIRDWARKIRVSPSKLYMPLSYAAILGGRLTVIGSSSNLVVMGLFVEWTAANPGAVQMSAAQRFWGPAALGLPAAVVGVAYIVLASRRLLPERKTALQNELDSRRYTVEMEVRPDSAIVGKSIEAAGLRRLPGLYLAQIERGDQSIPAPSPEWIIRAGDVLSFAGILESVVDLRNIRGLVPATDQVAKVSSEDHERRLVEAVVSHNSPLVGLTIRAARFRTTYNAAIIAVHRNGEQVRAKVGDIELRAGDTLLLETHRGFVTGYRNSDDFYLVSDVPDSTPLRHERGWIALAIFMALIATLAFSEIPPALAALIAALAMILTRCVTAAVARASVSIQVLAVIGAALGIGAAMRQTGAALAIADLLLSGAAAVGFGPQGMLFLIVLLTAAFAQVLSNNGAAALMFPIAMATAAELGVRPEAFVFTLILGAGTSFMTPMGYQTNLMVYGPGGYKFMDFVRMGTPLTLMIAILAALLAPLAFPF